jgi:hypothetical protein
VAGAPEDLHGGHRDVRRQDDHRRQVR